MEDEACNICQALSLLQADPKPDGCVQNRLHTKAITGTEGALIGNGRAREGDALLGFRHPSEDDDTHQAPPKPRRKSSRSVC